LINQQKMVDAQMQNLSARTAAVGGSGGGGASATSGPTDQRAGDLN
jgi:hypothetical protein